MLTREEKERAVDNLPEELIPLCLSICEYERKRRGIEIVDNEYDYDSLDMPKYYINEEIMAMIMSAFRNGFIEYDSLDDFLKAVEDMADEHK